jgi:succinate dehydrogenase hydrophobic membrane anchor protein
MNTEPANVESDNFIPAQNENQPIFPLAKNRGWPFVLAWLHRISGVWLVLVSCSVIYLLDRGSFFSLIDESTQTINPIVLIVMLLGILAPVLLHASNGGRLILYELFGCRNEGPLLRWACGLSFLYSGLLALVMLMGNQTVSSFFFWLLAFAFASLAGIAAAAKVRKTRHSTVWKWQRISGASLLIMIPAYLLFLFLDPSHISDAGMMTPSLQDYFIKSIHLLVLLGVLYHGGYGLLSIGWDYISPRSLRHGLTVLVTVILLFFAWLGIQCIF